MAVVAAKPKVAATAMVRVVLQEILRAVVMMAGVVMGLAELEVVAEATVAVEGRAQEEMAVALERMPD